MTIAKINPSAVHPPAGNYSHVAVVPPGYKLLVLSGQVGLKLDGSLPEAVEDQFDQALQNILAIVKSQGGSADSIVKLTFYYVEGPVDFSRHRQALAAMFGDRRPAMTGMRVVGLADPRYKVEVDALAAVAEER